ncbi:hypothetical protein DFH08DRAFT_927989 [Mycena albidolilacea]|uniref:PNPLA domain-containing protein n=1 Tax=Mycena albidolilacea TaxID=1033008 RepID=A0AAD7F5H9_9AGAR|nr:hypothetical protein DFH08DRAFT_927989 [Mycena albidolilacea]
MDNPETQGLRLLALDGGGIRGLSMLIILEHLMYKLKVEENLPAVPHPCDYFDLIGGTSTGGLIALMLGRLRMSVEDAVNAYGQLAKEVFSDVKPLGSDGRFKASKLEKAIKQIVRTRSASQNPEEKLEDTRNNACKMFVCTTTAVNMSLPVLLRTYNTPDHPAMDCTIWQAGRATSAVPTFFKQVKIGRPGMEEAYLDGGMGHNNPTAALLLEAKVLFPDKQIACIISLGTGQPHTINIPKPSLLNRFIPLDVVKAIQKIAMDCEKEHQSLAHHFDGVTKLYFRFNVEQGMQDIQLNQWEKLGDVMANTRQYIQSQPVVKQLADAVTSLSEKIGRVSTTSLATAAAHDGVKQSEAALALVRCPPSSQIFQGRQDILAKMTEYFSKDIGTRHIYVLHGLGGSGKTQISLKFLDTANHEATPRFTKQFFINASSLQTLDTAFKNIAIAHKIGNSLQDALSWLITQIEEWMLLFDNADDTNINLFPFFPRCTHGNIIITSRNPQLTVHGPTSHSKVGDMDEIDAIDLLLLRAAKEYSAETAKKALEIVKAGAYISKIDCFHQYLSIYQQHRARLLQECPEQSHDDYKWTVYTTWQISFEKLSPLAAEFLQMCSLLHYKNITEDIFKQAAAWRAEDKEDAQTMQEARTFLQNFLSVSGTWDLLSFMQILAEIKGYSLLDNHVGGTFSIHPLVHLWCQTTLKDEPKARECMTDILGMSVRLTDDRFQFRIGLMPHVDALIQSPAAVKPVFQRKYMKIYFDSGRYQETELFQATVLEKQKTLLGTDHPDTLLAMGNLAFTYDQLGRYQEAELLKATVLQKRKTLLGADHPHTLLAMGNLASTYSQLGRYQEAELLETTVLEKRKTLLGANHPDTLLVMANLASTYSQLGRYQEAELLKATVLEKQKTLLGADHPDTLLAMANLASTYCELGRYQEAELLKATVLEKRKTLLGADHPDTLLAMANLASTYSQLGRYQEAELLEATVLEKRKTLLGAEHPDTLRAMANLAFTYSQLGRYQEAELLETTVLEKRKTLLGADHPHTLLAMGNLASTYSELGRYQEAELLEATVLEKRKTLLGAEHPDTLLAMGNLASTYSELGRYQEAELLEATVLEKRKTLLGAEHPDTLRAMANLAFTYCELGRYQEAELLEATVLEKRKTLLGAEHPDTLLAMANLASTYSQLGRYQEAKEPQAQYDHTCLNRVAPCKVCDWVIWLLSSKVSGS